MSRNLSHLLLVSAVAQPSCHSQVLRRQFSLWRGRRCPVFRPDAALGHHGMVRLPTAISQVVPRSFVGSHYRHGVGSRAGPSLRSPARTRSRRLPSLHGVRRGPMAIHVQHADNGRQCLRGELPADRLDQQPALHLRIAQRDRAPGKAVRPLARVYRRHGYHPHASDAGDGSGGPRYSDFGADHLVGYTAVGIRWDQIQGLHTPAQSRHEVPVFRYAGVLVCGQPETTAPFWRTTTRSPTSCKWCGRR